MPAWSCVCLSVCLSVCQSVNILVYTFFIGLYLFNTAIDQVHFWHACTLGPGLYSPNVFGDTALINYANLCKICQCVNILVIITFYRIHFLSVYIFLIQQLIRFIFGMHVPPRIDYANLGQNHIKCSYFLISWQILLKLVYSCIIGKRKVLMLVYRFISF